LYKEPIQAIREAFGHADRDKVVGRVTGHAENTMVKNGLAFWAGTACDEEFD
jgi:hypothetical protein